MVRVQKPRCRGLMGKPNGEASSGGAGLFGDRGAGVPLAFDRPIQRLRKCTDIINDGRTVDCDDKVPSEGCRRGFDNRG